MLQHIRTLSIDIGPRLSGSDAEMAAVDYARSELERYGYAVEVQAFTGSGPDFYRPARITTSAVEGEIVAASLNQTPAGEMTARLVEAGNGARSDFPEGTVGAIVLIQRGVVTFNDMARNAEAAGAAGVIIANRERGPFIGEIDPPTDLPVVAIGLDEGEALRAALARGAVQVTIEVEPLTGFTAYNVIARPQGGACRTVSGGHLDSVPWTPGANDNASGSALVLELARAAAVAGLEGHCFALFGAEEQGLLGSAFFVSQLRAEERAALEAFYDYDVVAADARVLALGSTVLVDRADEVARATGLVIDLSRVADEIASDHLSFIQAGIPSVIVTTPDFSLIHTVDDTVENLSTESLADLTRLAFALLTTP